MKTLKNYFDFVEKYKPIKNKVELDSAFDGCMYETYGDEFNAILDANEEHVWTLVEEDGVLFITPKRRFVNRVGYFITEEPWEDENIQVVIDEN